MADYLEMVEVALGAVLSEMTERPAVLAEAMRWAVEGGGKRIRPQICLASAVAAGGRAEDALMPACAIEVLHSFTLVHDDLPSMDNDAMRRGKPSVWAKFGEANAVLAGDALQALAFDLAARSPRNAAAVVAELAARAVGVIRGQVEDLVLARGGGVDMETVDFVYEHKTADLFMAAAVMGALAAGALKEHTERLRTFAFNLGFAFQYEDDLLDGDSPYARDVTKRLVREATAAAVASLDGLPGDTSFLASLAVRLATRKE
jgi:geranylgeranyl diphosphate synthase type II